MACVRLLLRRSAIDDLMPSAGRNSHKLSSLASETTDTGIEVCAVLIHGLGLEWSLTLYPDQST